MTSAPFKRAAVIGWPIAHSLSPVIHNHWMRVYGIEGEYEKIAVEPETLAAAIGNMKARGFSGFNITVPHKEAIIPYLDKLAPLARLMGAVNTVKFEEDGTTTGFNTDGIGLLANLEKSLPSWPKDRPALVMGAGGAARAAALGLLNENLPFLVITNRTREKAEAIARDIGRGRMVVVDWAERHDVAKTAGLIVNTTTLGMHGNPPLELDLSISARDTVVYDIVYQPLVTPLLDHAQACGLRTVTGLGMLVYQAAAAFKVWFDIMPEYDDELRDRLEAVFK
ncbi:shikimate dehydrogenase [Kordiimonas aestuarii]|uniref:shikimate dehydrogenase n=1 Tax=Kordiimonas aestuarii TaxID=1005925 RepID=UPI0021CF8A02|nr:shikimate dehydrogenase [Kordiimonas aestuarii]